MSASSFFLSLRDSAFPRASASSDACIESRALWWFFLCPCNKKLVVFEFLTTSHDSKLRAQNSNRFIQAFLQNKHSFHLNQKHIVHGYVSSDSSHHVSSDLVFSNSSSFSARRRSMSCRIAVISICARITFASSCGAKNSVNLPKHSVAKQQKFFAFETLNLTQLAFICPCVALYSNRNIFCFHLASLCLHCTSVPETRDLSPVRAPPRPPRALPAVLPSPSRDVFSPSPIRVQSVLPLPAAR